MVTVISFCRGEELESIEPFINCSRCLPWEKIIYNELINDLEQINQHTMHMK